MINLLFSTLENLSVSPVFGSVAWSCPTITPKALFSATLPPLAHEIFVGASFVSVTSKVIIAPAESAKPSLTLK